MSAFKFNSVNVHAKADEIKALGEEVKKILDIDLPNAMTELQNVWKSNAATEYKKQFETIKAEFYKFYNAIQNMSDSIIAVETALNTTDEANNVSM